MKKISVRQLGDRLRREREPLGVRAAAKEIGISPATLSRVERGNLPDLETFAKLCQWLQIDPGTVLGVSTPKAANQAGVTAHFRADRAINPALAGALADLIIEAQEKLASEEN